MTRIPTTLFLGHSLVHYDGETEGEKAMRMFPGSRAAYAQTLAEFPPTRVSIEVFERYMAEARARASSDRQGEE